MCFRRTIWSSRDRRWRKERSDVRNSSSRGEDGEKNSGKLVLRNENNDNFKRDRTDIFQVETAGCLSPVHHITIGHDNTGLGAGWFCEKVKFPPVD